MFENCYFRRRNSQLVMKRKVIIDFRSMPRELRELMKVKYPSGYASHINLFSDRNGKHFFGFLLETDDTIYLVRLNDKKAKVIQDEILLETISDGYDQEETEQEEEFDINPDEIITDDEDDDE